MPDFFFGQFQNEHLDKIQKGVELFNSQMYWECHEELEDHWMEDVTDNARYVYWVIIQAATACYHYRNQNLEGAKGQIQRAKEKIKKCRELKVETSILIENLDWKNFTSLIESIPENSTLEDYTNLYKYQFPKYW